jgi:hypothetical protein
LDLRVLPGAAYPIVLGSDWLTRHEPVIHWRDGLVALTCLYGACVPFPNARSRIPLSSPSPGPDDDLPDAPEYDDFSAPVSRETSVDIVTAVKLQDKSR